MAVGAYLRIYPNALSRAGARASRLTRHPHVRAATRWFRAGALTDAILDEVPMPNTVTGIRQRLSELGNWRSSQGDLSSQQAPFRVLLRSTVVVVAGAIVA